MDRKIPAKLLRTIYAEWVSEYGSTFPLYGNDTVRHDISGSVRPLLSSTELPHIKVLAEQSGIPKKTLVKILEDDDFELDWEMVDTLLTTMGKTDCWWVELREWY